jgi:hypothetical protein
LELINKLLIHFKLAEKGIDDKLTSDEVDESKKELTTFLKNLSSMAMSVEKESDALTGVDVRLRKLVRNFMEARNRGVKFKSALYMNSPSKVLEFLNSTDKAERVQLIDGLTELRGLLEDHVASDTRDLIGEI